ncbi:cytochrome c [Winogradskyella sp.]|jgi:nitric oxide reductase subunit C|uniref:c-type cytochrome n=1 Tax=Winogradskyella sp. TaxID=1883156 RepID=UPI0025FB3114|nr:cytochrome c [Winogradskyella sp.]MCT4629978.1 cytochrome c [Winogradskyella sp.]
MLSKKQARNFFIGGTFVTFLVFIGLTVYSLSKPQDQANSENITEAVVRGKVIWEENNCMGCHTILGEGAYYAPELTKVIDRLNIKYDGQGEEVIKGILMSEVPWQPNGRKMVAYGFTEQEAEDMIEFLKWIGEIDLNGFDRVVSPLAKDKMTKLK